MKIWQRLAALTLAGMTVGAAPAQAACPAGTQTVLSCTARGAARALDVCVVGRSVTYAFGPRGRAPELQLIRDVAEIENRPWPGIGRTLWEETTFRNAGYAYLVFMSVDRMNESAPPEGGVIVMRGKKELARVDCDRGSATLGFWAISDAKEAVGICWEPDRQDWGSCN